MKTLLTPLVMCLLFGFTLTTTAQLDTPRGSQMASVMQRVGTTDITITYSRPKVNGREIWGKLVPFGLNDLGFGTSKAAPWRAGANENTLISFTHDVTIEGQSLSAGTYGLHMNIKDADNATLIFSKDTEAWGSYFYDPSQDALKVDVKMRDHAHTEILTYSFDEVEANHAVASLLWEKKAIPFKIEVDVPVIVMNEIRSQLKGQKGFARQSWEQAANYAMNNTDDMDEALDFVNAALEGNFFSEKTVNGLATKAQILMKKGDMDGFGATMDEAATIATPDQINRMGNYMLSLKEYDRAMKYYNMNLKDDPKNAAWHNSIGAAYKAKGENKMAIKHLKKSLALNPSERTKANSEKHLKELGAL